MRCNLPRMPETAPRETVQLTLRVHPALAQRLLSASQDRRARQNPEYTQRAILEEALLQWFKKNGYVNGK